MDGCWFKTISKKHKPKHFQKIAFGTKNSCLTKEKTTTKQRWREEDHQPEGAQ
jgi:hypothetical protein